MGIRRLGADARVHHGLPHREVVQHLEVRVLQAQQLMHRVVEITANAGAAVALGLGLQVQDLTDQARGKHAPAATMKIGKKFLSSAPAGGKKVGSSKGGELNGELRGWAGVRCASLDRLPLAGTLPDVAAIEALLGRPPFHRRKPRLDELPRVAGLFTLSALGSRGLTLASLCAEVLVAQALHQPAHWEPDLWATLDPARFYWRRLKRQQTV